MFETYDLVPRPSSHIKTLSRIGYTLKTAVGDILDNSIAASAENIWIDLYPNPDLGNEIELTIRDDGSGMNSSDLIENMRLSCKDPSQDRDENDLGRFGSGLKTASFSQCRKLTVISKNIESKSAAATWDLDLVEEENKWTLLFTKETSTNLFHDHAEFYKQHSGTVVIWRALVKYADMDSLDLQKSLESDVASLKRYTALYFHKFLSRRSKKISIFINRQKIQAIDPFMRDAPGYQESPAETFRIRKGGKIEIIPHIIPHESKLTPEQIESLGGVDGITANQGLYVYRSDRLIIEGGWHGLARLSLLGRLARVEVNVPSSLDDEWSTDVKKSTLEIPEKVKEKLKRLSVTPQKKSRRAYQYRGKLDQENPFWHIRTNERTGKVSYEINAKNEELHALLKALDDDDQQRAVLDYLHLLVKSLPLDNIFEKAASKNIEQDVVDVDKLYQEIQEAWKKVQSN